MKYLDKNNLYGNFSEFLLIIWLLFYHSSMTLRNIKSYSKKDRTEINFLNLQQCYAAKACQIPCI